VENTSDALPAKRED